jgi:hypothetical protein
MIGRRDPTRSAGLRRQGRGLVNRKVFELHKELRLTLQDNDVVGLRQKADMPAGYSMFVETPGNRLERGETMLRKLVEERLASPPDWLSGLIDRAVWRGLEQVGQELRTAVEHLDHTEVSRFHGNAVAVEVKGIASETERRVLRLVVEALDIEASPEALMRDVRTTLQKITRFRLLLLVNTAVVRAVNAGKLFGYRENGIKQVGIDPEWLPNHGHTHDSLVLGDRETRKAKVQRRKKTNKARRSEMFSARTQQRREQAERRLEAELGQAAVQVLTAGDDRVCDECDDIAADGPYDLDAARGLIPAHPNCRCAFIPFGDRRFAPIEEQWEPEEE